jgi:hypothetical protein
MVKSTDTTEVPPPDFIGPAVRCALEMVLVAAIILFAGLPASNPFFLGLILVVTVMAMVTVLFWSLNRQMEAWIARARRTGSRAE